MEFNKVIKLTDVLGKKEWVSNILYFVNLIDNYCKKIQEFKDFF